MKGQPWAISSDVCCSCSNMNTITGDHKVQSAEHSLYGRHYLLDVFQSLHVIDHSHPLIASFPGSARAWERG